MIKTKLIFSVGYDSFVYKKEKQMFNKKFVGELQLLNLLERELGLSGEFSTNKERQAEYLEYLSQKITDKNTFISESFNNDKIGVANELLKWRDELKVMNKEERITINIAGRNYPLLVKTDELDLFKRKF